MGKVLRANPASGSATLQYFLYPSPPVTEAWVTFDVLFPPETIAWFNDHGGNFILLLQDDASNNAAVLVTGVAGGLGVGGDPGAVWADGTNGGSCDAPAPDAAWHTVEYHYKQGVVSELYIDGTLRWSVAPSGSHDLNSFALGPWDTSGADAPFYFDNVKIGTTRGGSDIISDDFEAGTLSPSWSATGDGLTVVDDPTLSTFAVTYHPHHATGGSAPTDPSSPYAYGAVVTVLDQGSLTRPGFTFTGWNTVANGTGVAYSPADTFLIGSDVNLYAQWTDDGDTPLSYNVTYDGNGADGGTAPVDGANPYLPRARVTVLDQGDLTLTGYVFIGWNTRADGTGASYLPGQLFSMPARDYELYAQWKPEDGGGGGGEPHSVTYDGNGADGGTAPTDPASPYNAGDFVTVLDQGDLTETGHAFVGWNTAPDGSGHAFEPGQRFSMPDEDVTFYAQWAPASTLGIWIYDLGVTALADISGITLEKSMPRLANGPRAFTVVAPANDPLLTALWEEGDGEPILGDGGTRKLVVWENSDPETDDPIFHGRIFGCKRDSDENASLVTITAFDPWVELGFEADDRGGRILRDSSPATRGDQSFLTLNFESSVEGQSEISGPDLIRQALTYCQGDPTTDPIQGAGPLPIDIYSGEWDLEVPPAIDLDPRDTLDFPIMIGDFIAGLIDTNVVDFDLRPIRPGTGRNPAGDLDDYIMVEASAKSKLGVDRTGDVYFDHLTGSFNAKGAVEDTDYAKQNSHLWYELGPRLANEKWRAVLQPHDQPLHADLLPLIDAAAAYFGGPNDPPGYNEFIRVFDSLGTESSSRPLYEALYRYEILQRLYPRKLLYITPCDGAKALFTAPQDFDAFDLIEINVGADFGKTITAEAQRCYGYTKTWTRENVASLGQLLTSVDVG